VIADRFPTVAVTPLWPAGGLERLGAMCTDRELAGLSRRAVEKRRREWLTARALLKYLAVARPASSPLHLVLVDSESLSRLCVGDARRAEVVPAGRGIGAGPRLCSASAECRVSISHAGGWVAVASGATAPVGIDLEPIDVRDPAFYRNSFAEREIEWVRQAPPADHPLLFTLLWTLKESSLKAGVARAGSMWAANSIEVLVETPGAVVAARLRAAEPGALQALASGLAPHYAACGGWAGNVLSVVMVEPSAG
jgi:4'-phosphopantetheinyl transferase EntD